MLQACLELFDGKGGLLSLLDDSERFEAKEANQKFLSSLKQSFAPPGGSGGGSKRCVGAGSDGYSHGCVSLPSLSWNAKRMIQRHAILNEYFFVVGGTIQEGEHSTIDRGNTTSATLLVCSVPTVSFCSRSRRWFKLGSFFSIGSPARCVRSDTYLPGASTCLSCRTVSHVPILSGSNISTQAQLSSYADQTKSNAVRIHTALMALSHDFGRLARASIRCVLWVCESVVSLAARHQRGICVM